MTDEELIDHMARAISWSEGSFGNPIRQGLFDVNRERAKLFLQTHRDEVAKAAKAAPPAPTPPEPEYDEPVAAILCGDGEANVVMRSGAVWWKPYYQGEWLPGSALPGTRAAADAAAKKKEAE